MRLPVFLQPLALEDIREVFREFERVRSGLGRRFVRSLFDSLERIGDMPEIYGVAWRQVRAARLKKFRHIVYYVVFDDRIDVVAVMHGARDPSE